MSSWLRIALTAVAAIIGGWAGFMVIGGGAAGVAWLYLFGDDPWPAWAEPLILLFMVGGALLGAVSIGLAAWRSMPRAPNGD